jgi:hypothetical protein
LERVASSGHPRLFANAAEFAALKAEASKPGIRRTMLARLCVLSESILPTAPVSRVMEGRRLLGISRIALYRISTLALCYRMTGRTTYRDRCVAEMRAVAQFSDWNPNHFLDVAEMSLALATGYDWLYDELGDADKRLCEEALLKKGLQSSPEDAWWRQAQNNWGQVCHTGMLAAAVALADKAPEVCLEAAHEAVTRIAIPMRAYAPNGNYPEGPNYWEYGTGFNVLGLDIMLHAFGTDFGLSEFAGFRETGAYFDYMTGPSGKVFNYADGGASGRSRLGSVWWFARHFRQPELAESFERAFLERYGKDTCPPDNPAANVRWFHAYCFFWLFERPEKRPEKPTLPLVWNGGGGVPVVTMRNTWNASETVFVGLKGGSPGGPHGHMDGGSFVLEAAKVRWAVDLGAENYNRIEQMGLRLWNMRQDSDRWKLFRLNNFSHNTLAIDGHLQQVAGQAVFTEVCASPARAVMDLSTLYSGDCRSARRTIELTAEGVVTVTDELEGLKLGATVVWGLTTSEKVGAPQDGRVMLTHEDKRLMITSLGGGVWRVWDATQPNPKWDGVNPHCSRVELTKTAPENGRVVFRVQMALAK